MMDKERVEAAKERGVLELLQAVRQGRHRGVDEDSIMEAIATGWLKIDPSKTSHPEDEEALARVAYAWFLQRAIWYQRNRHESEEKSATLSLEAGPNPQGEEGEEQEWVIEAPDEFLPLWALDMERYLQSLPLPQREVALYYWEWLKQGVVPPGMSVKWRRWFQQVALRFVENPRENPRRRNGNGRGCAAV